jgi:hypothetical protein
VTPVNLVMSSRDPHWRNCERVSRGEGHRAVNIPQELGRPPFASAAGLTCDNTV